MTLDVAAMSPFGDYDYVASDLNARSAVESFTMNMTSMNHALLMNSIKTLQSQRENLVETQVQSLQSSGSWQSKLWEQWRFDMQMYRRLRSNWDSNVLWFTLLATILMLCACFTITYTVNTTTWTDVDFGAHLVCMMPSLNASVLDTTIETNVKVLSTVLMMGNYTIAFIVSLFLAIQCRSTRKKVMANPSNTDLTNVFVLPCYDMVCFVLVALSAYGIAITVGSLFIPTTYIYIHRGVFCFLLFLPVSWMQQLIPILMVQKSISDGAVQRSILLSGIVSFLLLIALIPVKDHIPVLYIIYHIASIGLYTWVKFISFSRASFDYIYIVLVGSSLVGILPSAMLLARSPNVHDDAYYDAYLITTVIENVIDSFTILAIMLTLRADTKYWLGIDYNSIHTKNPAQQYLRLIAEQGMASSFSTRTSVYDVHYMIEKFKRSMIAFSTLQLESVVAQGATSVVLKGSMQKTSRDNVAIAIKIFTSLFVTQEEVFRFSKEITLNIGLSHPNIVRFYGLCVVPPAICLVFEYCEWGSLELVLRAQRPQGPAREWDLGTKLKACVDACRAVAYLHSFDPPLLHRDIKTANFLLASDAMLKLSDFGESNLMRPKNDGTMTIVGSVDFMAPEMICGGGRPSCAVYGTAADVYSLTMTLWHILVPGRNPWRGKSHFDVYSEVVQGHRPAIPSHLPSGCIELLESGWAPEPENRPSMQDIALRFQNLWLLSTHQHELKRSGHLHTLDDVMTS